MITQGKPIYKKWNTTQANSNRSNVTLIWFSIVFIICEYYSIDKAITIKHALHPLMWHFAWIFPFCHHIHAILVAQWDHEELKEGKGSFLPLIIYPLVLHLVIYTCFVLFCFVLTLFFHPRKWDSTVPPLKCHNNAGFLSRNINQLH